MPGERSSWWSWIFGGGDTSVVGGTRSAPSARAPQSAAEPAVKRPRRARRAGPPRQRLLRPPQRVAAPATRSAPVRAGMVGVRSWAYQLQDIKIAEIGQCPADLCVIDCSPDGRPELAFTRDQVERMQGLDGGHRKRVVCYMSIGEAEADRFYWDERWIVNGKRTKAAPGWLGPANDRGWRGNYNVRYWDRDWQRIIIDRPDSFLNRVIDAGFDGVFLDIVDGFEFWRDNAPPAERRPTAADDMVELVSRIAQHAWTVRGRSQFLIVPQNGEELLEHDRYRAHVSAIAKEDILYDMVGRADDHPAVGPRPAPEIESIRAYLKLAASDRLPILAVEYLLDPPADQRRNAEAVRQLRAMGLVPHLAVRALDRLSDTIRPETLAA
jgi:cysteinyl-tRNA synthetase